MRGRRGSGDIIAEYGFAQRNNLAGAVVPDEVKSIGAFAFSGCGGLVSVNTGNGAEEIGKGAFSHCEALTEITIGKSVKTICCGAFFNSGLRDIYYKGTKEQWKAIEKCKEWDRGTGNYIIHCTDGDINK